MNLQETEAERVFRAQVRAWMGEHLCGEFEALRNASGLGSPGYEAALAKRWEQQLAGGGWIGLGGRAATAGANCPWRSR